jgi:hypothetical protein
MTTLSKQKANTEPHAGLVDKPEVHINEDVARLFRKTSHASFQHLAIVFRGFYLKLLNRDDTRENKQRSSQNCETSLRCCQGSACQDLSNVLTAGAAVGLVSQWLPGCDTNCRLVKSVHESLVRECGRAHYRDSFEAMA